jgi:hypothetical protein
MLVGMLVGIIFKDGRACQSKISRKCQEKCLDPARCRCYVEHVDHRWVYDIDTVIELDLVRSVEIST